MYYFITAFVKAGIKMLKYWYELFLRIPEMSENDALKNPVDTLVYLECTM